MLIKVILLKMLVRQASNENMLGKPLIVDPIEKDKHIKSCNILMYETKVCNEQTSVFVERDPAIIKVKTCLNEGFVVVINNPANDNHENNALFKYTTHNVFNLISYKSFQIHPLVKGDSPTSQAYAIRLAMVKCLLCLDDDIRLILKTNSYTSTDCRMVDRKEAGCCKAGNHTDLPNMERRDDKGYPNHLNDNHRANPWLLSEPGSDLNNIEAAIVVRISLGFNINNAASS